MRRHVLDHAVGRAVAARWRPACRSSRSIGLREELPLRTDVDGRVVARAADRPVRLLFRADATTALTRTAGSPKKVADRSPRLHEWSSCAAAATPFASAAHGLVMLTPTGSLGPAMPTRMTSLGIDLHAALRRRRGEEVDVALHVEELAAVRRRLRLATGQPRHRRRAAPAAPLQAMPNCVQRKRSSGP